MPYICTQCQAAFDEPDHQDDSFDHAFGTHRQTASVCPRCGSAEINRAQPCKNFGCSGWMRPGDALCLPCRRGLLQRVRDFFDRLTRDDEEQFDRWMEDCASIRERKDWRAEE